MIKYVDRLLIVSYFKAYFFCLLSMLSLYVVVDLFTNIDDFTQHSHGLKSMLQHIGMYYGYKVPQIFDRLCEAIVLLAAMFTVAWMQRSNELLPLLSAGMSTRRVVLPVLVSAFIMLSLAALNQELVLPEIASNLMNEKSDPDGKTEIRPQSAFEPNGIHLEPESALPKSMIVKLMYITIPDSIANNLVHLTAKQAHYIPKGTPGAPRTEGWLLSGVKPETLPELKPDHPILEQIDPGKYFLHTKQVDFDAVTRHRNWFNFASTYGLYQELQKPDSTRLSSMAIVFHMRLTRPILGIILVVMGLSVILRDQNRNVFISAGMCLVLCGIFFAACFASKQLGDSDFLAPALSAWLPVFFFGPVSLAMFDAVHT
jgi:lipopolysaccharide export system permease protein